MIIKLPYIYPIDTLNLPEDFKTKVSNSFAKFTAETDPRYTSEDKLAYLDNLRKYYIMIKDDSIESVKDLILTRTEHEILENDDFPVKEDFYSFNFMTECYELGEKNSRFLNSQYEDEKSDNAITLNVIADIIKIVMNWKPFI